MRNSRLTGPLWRYFTGIIVAIVMFMMFVPAETKAADYCNPGEPPKDYMTFYCWSDYYRQNYGYDYYYHAWFKQVRIRNLSTNDYPLDYYSANEGCYDFKEDVSPQLMIGTDYELYTRRYQNYYYCYYYYRTYNTYRVWLDWNQDGDFDDEGEFLYGTRIYTSVCTDLHHYLRFSVDCDVPLGKTRLRVATSYYYPYGSYVPEWRNACINGYYYDYGTFGYYYAYGEVEDYEIEFVSNISDAFPNGGDIWYAGEDYDGTTRNFDGVDIDFFKPSVTFSSAPPSGTQMSYQMRGPLPSNDLVYEGRDPVTQSTWIDIGGTGNATYTMQLATGDYAINNDGSFHASSGGEYRVNIEVPDNGTGGCPGVKSHTFTVSWENDLSTRDILVPRANVAPTYFKYLRGQVIRPKITYQNVGLNDVTEFMAYAKIFDPDGSQVWEGELHYDANNTPGHEVLNKGEKVDIEFPTFRSTRVGVYTIEAWCDLQNAADQDDWNDYLPRPTTDADWTFEIQHEIQLQSDEIKVPENGQTLIGNRPIEPKAVFKNVGIGDASDVPAKMLAYKLPDMEKVYESNIIVQDIPSGTYNTKTEFFDIMTLSEDGDYQICIIITSPDDIVREDDTLCISVTVEGGLNGTYTVGSRNDGDIRNFANITDAMNAIFRRGLAGPIVMELTDQTYTITSEEDYMPAWDFSSFILNLGYDATTGNTNSITWKPSRERELLRGGVTINLNTKNGQGIYFGQSVSPTNPYAVYNDFASKGSLAKKYANNQGYITFDGGNQKSLRFNVNNINDGGHAVAFYLNKGSQHITVKNCLINNTSTVACEYWIPGTSFDDTEGFLFHDDIYPSPSGLKTYSAAIVNRGTLMTFNDFQEEQVEFIRLDTVPNKNNEFTGNEIQGFGIGIISAGIGQLWEQSKGSYERFYNTGTKILNNKIYDVCRTGIFLGYEDNAIVNGNHIYNVGVEEDDVPAAGILLGGENDEDSKGYNNINVTISGNEISNISSTVSAKGIEINQSRNLFDENNELVYFPDGPDNIHVMNNVVWGLNNQSANATRAGIHVFTDRTDEDEISDEERLVTPMYPNYNMEGNKIVNNTIIIEEDGFTTLAPIAGIGIQQANGAIFKNNAIVMRDNTINGSSESNAALLYQGVLPTEEGGLVSDRNAYELDADAAAIARFIQTDEDNGIIDLGHRDDFQTLHQWQMWTHQDYNSVNRAFSQDFTVPEEADDHLRIVVEPLPPIGSVLNNRGEVFNWFTTDIDGIIRGVAGQRFDIGAIEFDGRMYISDLEVVSAPTPGAYQSNTGNYNDAEYIMTEAPVQVVANLRNNGNLLQSDVNVTVRIYLESPDGSFDMASPVLEESVPATIQSTESISVDFLLNDGIGEDFYPETYADLTGYTPNAMFGTMLENVTPLYKIVITVDADQDNLNNSMEKTVRFYLMRSPLRMVVSAENSMYDAYGNPTPAVDVIAGRLNYDAIMAGLGIVGWENDDVLDQHDIDIFDRNGWEPRAVDYSMYRTMFWSDGEDKALTRYEIIDVNHFLSNGSMNGKKNLVISSQEMVRECTDEDFLYRVLRAESVAPHNPMGAGVSNVDNQITGVALARDYVQTIVETGAPGDALPYCGLYNIQEGAEGLARVAFTYNNHDGAPENNIMGIATTTLTRNVVLLGVDWRHYEDIEFILRGVLDFGEKNGGVFIPVELLSFDAEAAGNRVDVTWQTASEMNTDRFEVERAEKSAKGTTHFTKIAEEAAAGESATATNYGPVVDRNVEFNNTYIYRLKMVDVNGEFEYSDQVEVTIGGADGAWLEQANPNPAQFEASFSYTLATDGDINISLYDMNGKMVETVFNGNQTAGTHDVTLNLANLSNGTYTYVLRIGDNILSKQINIVK